jgi:hypothetical protein
VPALRPLLTYLAVVIGVFVAALAIGYVYEHDPERDLVEVVIDRSAIPAGDGEFAAGTVLGVDGSTAQVTSSAGSFELNLADLSIEALQPVDDPLTIPPGTAVNLGGERAPTEPVISGVVLIAPQGAP